MNYKIPDSFECIDAHEHVYGSAGRLDRNKAQELLEAADRLGIHKLCISYPATTPCPSPKEFKILNNIVLEAMEISDRFIGFCFVNPGFAREATAEIKRCVQKHRMAGIKLYHQYLICDPAQHPVMETAAELGVPVLMHAGKCTDPATSAAQPRLSSAEHFLKALKMFPDTMLIQGHIGGGGDWEWNLRELEKVSGNNYFIDISGSIIDAGIVRKTVAAVGADRVLFATDMSLEEGVGKVMDAGLSTAVLRKIFSGNMKRIFARRNFNVV